MNPSTNDKQDEARLIRQPKVLELTGQSRSSLYDAINKGTFPAPVKIGGRAVAFVEHEVLTWIKARIAERDNNSSSTR